MLHNDLATALDAGGKHNEAEYHARASLAIMSDACAKDSDVDMEYCVRVYYNLGIILSHQGKIKLRVYQNLYPNQHLHHPTFLQVKSQRLELCFL